MLQTSYLKRILLGALLVALGSTTIRADNSYLSVGGEVAKPLNYSQAEFEMLPRISVQAKGSNGAIETYEGVELTHILRLSGVKLGADLKGADLANYLVVEGADDFRIVVALPELDTERIVLADTMNGQKLGKPDGPIRLVLPNSARRSRWVKGASTLRISKAN